MHLLTTPLLYRILTFKASPQRTRIVGLILLTLFTLVMVIHIVMDEFILHAVSFGIAVYLIATESLKIISQQVPDLLVRKQIRNIAFFGACMFRLLLRHPRPPRCNDHRITDNSSLFRFWLHCVANWPLGLWNLDRNSTLGWAAPGILHWAPRLVCSSRFRHIFNRPVSLITRNRWHIFTAIGGYVAVAIVDMVTTGKVLEDPTKEFAWPIGPAARVIESLNAPKKHE